MTTHSLHVRADHGLAEVLAALDAIVMPHTKYDCWQKQAQPTGIVFAPGYFTPVGNWSQLPTAATAVGLLQIIESWLAAQDPDSWPQPPDIDGSIERGWCLRTDWDSFIVELAWTEYHK